MKCLKKIASCVLAAAMALTMSATAFAATTTGTITISNTTKDNTYKVYKVFDAVGDGEHISYKLVSGKTTAPTGFKTDDAGNVIEDPDATSIRDSDGNLTEAAITAIAEYVKNDTPAAEKTAIGESLTFDGLSNGYYYVATTTGTAVTIDSTNPNATIKDKNEPPVLTKIISDASSVSDEGKKALAQVGTNVEYTVTIDVKKGAAGYVFHDKMDSVLSYNNDLTVKVGDAVVEAKNYSTTTAAGDTLTVTFDNTWIATQVGNKITLTYTAKCTSDALSQTPAENTATLDYGNGYTNTVGPEKTQVYNANYKVTKVDGSNNPLAGAGFVLKNADGKYFKAGTNSISWVDSVEDATEYTTTAQSNVVTFAGLCDGTYTLVENTTPDGYNTAADQSFTVKSADYTVANLEQSGTVVNNAGVIFPSTGGIGSTIFYVVGAVVIVGAVSAFVIKKNKNGKNENKESK